MNKWIFFGIGLSGTSAWAGMDGRAIMLKNEEARKVSDVQSQAVIVTGEPGAVEKTKKFTWWKKLQADKVHYFTLTRFHFPAEVRGEGILFLEHGGEQNNEVMLYLPTFKKIRRVENAQQSGSFMSSEFSYSDISTPHVDDYKYQLKREEKCPEAEAAKQQCFVVQSEPATDVIRDRT